MRPDYSKHNQGKITEKRQLSYCVVDIFPAAYCEPEKKNAMPSKKKRRRPNKVPHIHTHKQAAPKEGTDAAGQSSVEDVVKVCCDNFQKRLQKEFDRNLDILDRYFKKNVSAALTTAAGASSADGRRLSTAGAAAELGRREGASPVGNMGGAAGAGAGARAGAMMAEGGARGGNSMAGRGDVEVWGFEVEEGSAPKRLEEETALDAEVEHVRKRRREVGDI